MVNHEAEESLTLLSEPEIIRKRLTRRGSGHLSNQELFTILLSPGSKKVTSIVSNLLKTFDGDLKELFSASIEELTQAGGIGFVKACQIQAAFELIKRVDSYCKEEHPLISSTDDVVTLMAPHMRYLKQEEFRVLLLDGKNKLIRYHRISVGSLDQAVVHPRDVFRPAIAAGAASIILVHNHPSGDPTPSDQDILLTRELCMCSKVVSIEVLDHVIIGSSDYASMKLRELM